MLVIVAMHHPCCKINTFWMCRELKQVNCAKEWKIFAATLGHSKLDGLPCATFTKSDECSVLLKSQKTYSVRNRHKVWGVVFPNTNETGEGLWSAILTSCACLMYILAFIILIFTFSWHSLIVKTYGKNSTLDSVDYISILKGKVLEPPSPMWQHGDWC